MNKMLKLSCTALLAAALAACSSSSSSSEGTDGLNGTYTYHIGGYDWGAGVDKVTVTFDSAVDEVSPDMFTVTETKNATDWSSETFEIKETTFDRKVEDAYLSDAQGVKTDSPSKYVTLDLYVSPNDGSPMNYDFNSGRNSWCDPYFLTIGVAEGQKLKSEGKEISAVVIDTKAAGKTTDADSFKTASFKAEDGTEYQYAYYEPAEKSNKLFVWLHGGGEGATENSDPYIVTLANKVTAYTSEAFQKELGNAWVLAPQCPTLWMDNGKLGDNWMENLTADSLYTQSLTELIDSFAKEHDLDKIVIAGCSNGGFMTVNMAVANGDKYDAYVPIAEGFIDTAITDDVVNKLKDLPMYFIYAENDDTLDPEHFSKPLLSKLEEAGASNLKVSTTKNVTDSSGKYKNEKGEPYEYSGHWSWIYFDNNESVSNDDQTSSWSWIAQQIQ
ncbi:MAG: hypothetical protein HUJ55_04805 [Ileibacterium sp.]|nr:hypothetical protein [Ileibacterium sp.]